MKKKKKTNLYPAHTNRGEEDRKQTEMVLIAGQWSWLAVGLVLIVVGHSGSGSDRHGSLWVAMGLGLGRWSIYVGRYGSRLPSQVWVTGRRHLENYGVPLPPVNSYGPSGGGGYAPQPFPP
ncbi:hypothetical protein SO802_013219 [Lithocarpus litseifolius]|uniref:Transmembrane protein n=1 Tax=Lithocarpus litseifolius TaxID=425828 RepID=A0AAW2D506_9ROSI